MLKQCSLLGVILSLIYLSGASETPLTFANDAFKFVNATPNYLLFNGDTYYYVGETQRNWFEARGSCEDMGFNLISFETIKEFNAINGFLDDTGGGSNYWTSGSDFMKLGHHAWFPSGKSVPSNLWATNQPDNKDGEEHCDLFRYNGAHYMNDAICTLRLFYVCELNLLSTGN